MWTTTPTCDGALIVIVIDDDVIIVNIIVIINVITIVIIVNIIPIIIVITIIAIIVIITMATATIVIAIAIISTIIVTAIIVIAIISTIAIIIAIIVTVTIGPEARALHRKRNRRDRTATLPICRYDLPIGRQQLCAAAGACAERDGAGGRAHSTAPCLQRPPGRQHRSDLPGWRALRLRSQPKRCRAGVIRRLMVSLVGRLFGWSSLWLRVLSTCAGGRVSGGAGERGTNAEQCCQRPKLRLWRGLGWRGGRAGAALTSIARSPTTTLSIVPADGPLVSAASPPPPPPLPGCPAAKSCTPQGRSHGLSEERPRTHTRKAGPEARTSSTVATARLIRLRVRPRRPSRVSLQLQPRAVLLQLYACFAAPFGVSLGGWNVLKNVSTQSC